MKFIRDPLWVSKREQNYLKLQKIQLRQGPSCNVKCPRQDSRVYWIILSISSNFDFTFFTTWSLLVLILHFSDKKFRTDIWKFLLFSAMLAFLTALFSLTNTFFCPGIYLGTWPWPWFWSLLWCPCPIWLGWTWCTSCPPMRGPYGPGPCAIRPYGPICPSDAVRTQNIFQSFILLCLLVNL